MNVVDACWTGSRAACMIGLGLYIFYRGIFAADSLSSRGVHKPGNYCIVPTGGKKGRHLWAELSKIQNAAGGKTSHYNG